MNRTTTLLTLAVLSTGVAAVPTLARAADVANPPASQTDSYSRNDTTTGMTGNTQENQYPTKNNQANEVPAISATEDGTLNSESRTTAPQAQANAAANTTSVRNLPKEGNVQVSGTVQEVKQDEFTLADSTGTVTISASPSTASSLKEGDQVRVSGVVDKGIFSTEIKANNVSKVGSATMQ